VSEAASPDFDFRHHLYDTILLLGGKKEIADLLEKSIDGAITEMDVDALRNFNIELIESAKRRLASIHTIKIQPRQSD
jgi:hypothetical protein